MAWYKCNITHNVRQEDGSLKIDVTEPYVFEAQSVTEAAARLAAHLEGETYTLEGVTRMRLQEVFFEAGEWGYPFYLAKVSMTSLDEKSGLERRRAVRYLIEADDLAAALERLQEEFKVTVSDWELVSLSKSPIVEVVTAEKKEGTAA